MRFIDAKQVHQLLDYPSLVDALAENHKKDVDPASSVLLQQPTPAGDTSYFLASAAWQKGKALGSKLVTVFPDNEHNASGLPSVQAVYVLFDGASGKPNAWIDGTALTLRKTAADSALGTRLLANPAPTSMLMVGAGALAPHLIEAHKSMRPSIQQVRIWNRTPERAQHLANSLQVDGVRIEATTDLETATREADLISCATMATEPLIKGPWLKPGAHLDLVGSYRQDMHECDEAAMVRGSVFTDSPWSAASDCGEITSALKNGSLKPDDILANIFTLVRGEHPGRSDVSEITVFENGGGGHLDLMAANFLVSRR